MHVQSRVFAAFILTLTAFIISFLVLMSGTNGFLEDAAIANSGDLRSVDGLQRAEFPGLLDESDWQSVHYHVICQGNFLNGTSTKTNISCLRSDSLQNAYIPWTIGMAFSGHIAFTLPFFFGGRWHCNGWVLYLFMIPWLTFVIGGLLATLYAEVDARYIYPAGPGKLFLPMTWASVGCVFVAIIIHSFEYGLQKFTPPGEIIAAKYKPANMPWVSCGRRQFGDGCSA